MYSGFVKFLSFLLGFIPGFGHAHTGYVFRGFLYFFCCVSLLNAYFVLPLVYPDSFFHRFQLYFLAGFFVLWLLSLLDLYRILGRTNEEQTEES